MIRIVLLVIMAMAYLQGQAQKETNWWYFGAHAGLNFNALQTAVSSTGVSTPNLPKPVMGPLLTSEGCFTLSDKNGNLLMSSDGMTIYDKNNNIMFNGNGLAGGPSSSQSGIVVPNPGNASQYYIITVAQDLGAAGVRYSLVDLSLNGGLGSVILKNQPLKADASYENIAIVSHKNGIDYWLIHRTVKTFYVWSITPSGISSTPATYTVSGITTQCKTPFIGCMKFSQDFTRFIATTYLCNSIVSGEFDNNTGVISNVQDFFWGAYPYSAEFSLSKEWIFLGCESPVVGYKIKWDDLRKGTITPTSLGIPIINLQLASDGRIYGIQKNTRNLHVIMDPDNGGTDIRSFANYLTSNAIYGLPTFATTFFNADVKEKSFVCAGNDFRYTIEVSVSGTATTNQPTKLVWDFGDGTSTVSQNIVANQTTYKQIHNYAATGKYTITITPYKANGAALSNITMPANVIECVFKTNRMIRTDLQNTATKAVNR